MTAIKYRQVAWYVVIALLLTFQLMGCGKSSSETVTGGPLSGQDNRSVQQEEIKPVVDPSLAPDHLELASLPDRSRILFVKPVQIYLKKEFPISIEVSEGKYFQLLDALSGSYYRNLHSLERIEKKNPRFLALQELVEKGSTPACHIELPAPRVTSEKTFTKEEPIYLRTSAWSAMSNEKSWVLIETPETLGTYESKGLNDLKSFLLCGRVRTVGDLKTAFGDRILVYLPL